MRDSGRVLFFVVRWSYSNTSSRIFRYSLPDTGTGALGRYCRLVVLGNVSKSRKTISTYLIQIFIQVETGDTPRKVKLVNLPGVVPFSGYSREEGGG